MIRLLVGHIPASRPAGAHLGEAALEQLAVARVALAHPSAPATSGRSRCGARSLRRRGRCGACAPGPGDRQVARVVFDLRVRQARASSASRGSSNRGCPARRWPTRNAAVPELACISVSNQGGAGSCAAPPGAGCGRSSAAAAATTPPARRWCGRSRSPASSGCGGRATGGSP